MPSYLLEPEVLTAFARFFAALFLSIYFVHWHFKKPEEPDEEPYPLVHPIMESEFYEQEWKASESNGRLFVDHYSNVNGVETRDSWTEELP